MFTWAAFFAQLAVINSAVSTSNNAWTEDGLTVSWGQSSFLVLAAAFVHFGWGYEGLKWRAKF